MSQRVDMSEVDRLRAALEQALERTRKVSRTEALRMLAPELRALRSRGYTVEDIVQLLHGNGWSLGIETVRACVGGRRVKRARPAAAPAERDESGGPAVTKSAESPQGEAVGTVVAATGPAGSEAAPRPSRVPHKPPVFPSTDPRVRVAKAEARDPADTSPKSTFTPREDSDEI
jgi:hypothetical protein